MTAATRSKFALFFLVLGSPLLLMVDAAEPQLRGGINDPKTVEAKQSQVNNEDHQDLKYVFFGTSRTFGVFMPSRNEAFPALVSPTAVNLGIPAGNPIYPTRCAASMLTEYEPSDAFDVVVLEYDASQFSSTVQLARRLRQRYPKAVLLFLKMWIPLRYEHVPTNGTPLQKWATDHNMPKTPDPDPMPKLKFIQDLSEPQDWRYYAGDEYTADYTKEIELLGGYLVSAPRPANAHEAWEKYGKHYLWDLNHYSRKGHQFVAGLIKDALKNIHFRSHHDPTVNVWEHYDQCYSWFRTGDAHMIQHNMVMNQFNSEKGKFALEAPTGQKSFIKFTNLHTEPMELIVEYMTTSPDNLYPSATLSLGNQSVVTSWSKRPYSWQVHVTTQIRVGTVPAAQQSTLFVHTTTGGEGQQWPFRIVSLLLVPKDLNF